MPLDLAGHRTSVNYSHVKVFICNLSFVRGTLKPEALFQDYDIA
jgi:hypothetical protein